MFIAAALNSNDLFMCSGSFRPIVAAQKREPADTPEVWINGLDVWGAAMRQLFAPFDPISIIYVSMAIVSMKRPTKSNGAAYGMLHVRR